LKLLLDSIYLIGIIETSIDHQFLSRLANSSEYRLYCLLITLFEISAKGAKFIQMEELIETDVIDGLNALRYWKKVILECNPNFQVIQSSTIDL